MDKSTQLKTFQQVVIFLTARSIKKNFQTLTAYFSATLSQKARSLHIDWKFMQSLTRSQFKDFVALSAQMFKYHRHFGQQFKVPSWFEVNEDILQLCFEDNCSFDFMKTKLLGPGARAWYSRHVLHCQKREHGKSSKKRDEMTKSEKEQLKARCDAGELALSYEDLVKDREKKERREAKRLKNISKKAYVELQSRITELESKVQMLECENDRLKSYETLEVKMQDLQEKLARYEEFVKKFTTDREFHLEKEKKILSKLDPSLKVCQEMPSQLDNEADEIVDSIIDEEEHQAIQAYDGRQNAKEDAPCAPGDEMTEEEKLREQKLKSILQGLEGNAQRLVNEKKCGISTMRELLKDCGSCIKVREPRDGCCREEIDIDKQRKIISLAMPLLEDREFILGEKLKKWRRIFK